MLDINEVYQGDCLDWMGLIDDQSVDMILCDLPYGTTMCKWDSIIPLDELWEDYKRIIKSSGAIVLTAAQPFTSKLINSNFENFAFCWVWDKIFGANFVQAKRQPIKTHEDIVVFSKDGKQPNYYPQMVPRDKPIFKGKNAQDEAIPIAITEKSRNFGKKRYDTKYPISILRHNVRSGRGLHPTQKPVELFEYLIKTYTQPGELVLDNCAGSGTTAAACINTDRDYILIEQEPKYVQICEQRITNTLKGVMT